MSLMYKFYLVANGENYEFNSIGERRKFIADNNIKRGHCWHTVAETGEHIDGYHFDEE